MFLLCSRVNFFKSNNCAKWQEVELMTFFDKIKRRMMKKIIKTGLGFRCFWLVLRFLTIKMIKFINHAKIH